MMIIDRGQPHEENWPPKKWPGPLVGAKNLLGIQRMAFLWKLLIGLQSIPGQISRFSEGAHLFRRRGKLAGPWSEAPGLDDAGDGELLSKVSANQQRPAPLRRAVVL